MIIKYKNQLKITLFFLLSGGVLLNAQRQMEFLNRGLIAVVQNNHTVFLSWRLLGNDPENIGFNVYRVNGKAELVKVNNEIIYNKTNFIDSMTGLKNNEEYYLKSVIGGIETESFGPVEVWKENYLSIPLQITEGYRPGDASVGDLDGDGTYEIIIHQAGRGRDNAHNGLTNAPFLEAYKLDGTFLWRINLGINIREGAHYTQFMVYDLDGDGKAEIACKTSDGTIDGQGKIIGYPDSVYRDENLPDFSSGFNQGNERGRNPYGHILKGPEYLTVFNGLTGAEITTAYYIPARHPKNPLYPTTKQLYDVWGDGYGNRSERYLACIAYLDGKNPSLVMCRGYYTRSVLAAWNFKNGSLSHLWTFDSDDGTQGNDAYRGQGNHNLSVGDVDNDGKDEIIYGACVIDDNGKGLYSTGFGHGDALHFSDLDPDNPGLEVFNIQERFDDAGMNFREAGSGKIIWKIPSVKADEEGGDKGEGPGRGNAFNIDPRYQGAECWVRGAGITGLYNAKGEKVSASNPRVCNFALWWDGDLLRELLDRNIIYKWNYKENKLDTLFYANACMSINGSKATPVLSADLFGDWREEVIWRTNDNSGLRIYTSTVPTEFKFYTFMHDPIYRLGIAWQNVAYNQPPHTGFYIGDEKTQQPKFKGNIVKVE